MGGKENGVRTIKIVGTMLGIFLIAAIGCSEDDPVGVTNRGCKMSGTITDLGGSDVYAGGAYTLYIDADPDPDNGNHVKAFTDTFPAGGQLKYNVDISDVTPGTYYLHMTMDLGPGPFHVGYYGATPNPWDVPPSANAAVQCGAVLDFNISD